MSWEDAYFHQYRPLLGKAEVSSLFHDSELQEPLVVKWRDLEADEMQTLLQHVGLAQQQNNTKDLLTSRPPW